MVGSTLPGRIEAELWLKPEGPSEPLGITR